MRGLVVWGRAGESYREISFRGGLPRRLFLSSRNHKEWECGSGVVAEKLEEGRILPSLESLRVALRLMESQELAP